MKFFSKLFSTFEMNFDIFTAIFQMPAPSILTNYRTNCFQNFISSQKFHKKFHKIISLKGHKDLHEPYSKSCIPNIQDFSVWYHFRVDECKGWKIPLSFLRDSFQRNRMSEDEHGRGPILKRMTHAIWKLFHKWKSFQWHSNIEHYKRLMCQRIEHV